VGGLLIDKVVPDSYEYGEWHIKENKLKQSEQPQGEAVFSVGNGFIGLRGVLEESDPEQNSARPCTFLNGVYEKVSIDYYEKAHGFAQYSDTRIPAADASKIEIYVDGEQFRNGNAQDHTRTLNYLTGELTRTSRWHTASGKILELTFRRFASHSHPNLLAMQLTLNAVNFSGSVSVKSHLDARFGDTTVTKEDIHDPRLSPQLTNNPWQYDSLASDTGNTCGFIHKLSKSGFLVACIASHTLLTDVENTRSCQTDEYLLTESFELKLAKNIDASIEKLVVYAANKTTSTEALRAEAVNILNAVTAQGYTHLLAEQKDALAKFWQSSTVKVTEELQLQSSMRFNLLQLQQAVGKDGSTSISAKGQTGEGYEGHYFWDAEVLCLPFFAFCAPELAKQMLRYRYKTLDTARDIAQTMGHKKGALYPWRTISGHECSAYFPAGTAQYHINADIAHATKLYHQITGDDDFMQHCGAEIIWETARIWLDMGFFCARKNGDFVINGVTGPDEYTAMVNNNFYTNVMAKAHLEYAASLFDTEIATQTMTSINVTPEEVDTWRKAAKSMHLPYDESLGIHMQDDSFLDKEIWDFENTPPEKYPLLLHYHPLTLYRYQVSKQADTVLALFLEGQDFSHQSKLKSYQYYKDVCIHDSTLSPCAYSILGCELGELQEAHDFFDKTIFIDVENLHQNSDHGLHMAAMGGGWMSLTYGFAGMRTHKDQLSFRPKIPGNWPSYSFRLSFRGCLIEVEVAKEGVQYTWLSGNSITLKHEGTDITLSANKKHAERTLVNN